MHRCHAISFIVGRLLTVKNNSYRSPKKDKLEKEGGRLNEDSFFFAEEAFHIQFIVNLFYGSSTSWSCALPTYSPAQWVPHDLQTCSCTLPFLPVSK